jgi:hypothetical protein
MDGGVTASEPEACSGMAQWSILHPVPSVLASRISTRCGAARLPPLVATTDRWDAALLCLRLASTGPYPPANARSDGSWLLALELGPSGAVSERDDPDGLRADDAAALSAGQPQSHASPDHLGAVCQSTRERSSPPDVCVFHATNA